MKTRVIIAGSRGFNDYALLKRKLNELLDFDDDITIISGTANGADSLGEKLLWDGKSKENIVTEFEWISQRGSEFKVIKRAGNTIYLQLVSQLKDQK